MIVARGAAAAVAAGTEMSGTQPRGGHRCSDGRALASMLMDLRTGVIFLGFCCCCFQAHIRRDLIQSIPPVIQVMVA